MSQFRKVWRFFDKRNQTRTITRLNNVNFQTNQQINKLDFLIHYDNIYNVQIMEKKQISTGRLMHRDHMLYTCSRMRFDFKKERKLAICDQMNKGGVLLL